MNHLLKPPTVPAPVATSQLWQGAKIEIATLPVHLRGPGLLQQARLLASMLGYPVELARREEDAVEGKVTVLSFGRSTAYAEMVMKVPTALMK